MTVDNNGRKISEEQKFPMQLSGHTFCISALDFDKSLVWNIKFDELDFFLFWTGFLQATQAVKIQFKLGKNPVHQTQNFKLENAKNQVHMKYT